MQGFSLPRSLIASRGALICACLLLVSFLTGCSVGEEEPVVRATPSPVLTGGPGPYVSVAVDNHFHDVHPVDKKEIDADEAFVVRNEGSNLHNVTFPGLDINVDIEPGESWRIDPVAKLGGPGTYKFICKYHAEDRMRGVFTVVEK